MAGKAFGQAPPQNSAHKHSAAGFVMWFELSEHHSEQVCDFLGEQILYTKIWIIVVCSCQLEETFSRFYCPSTDLLAEWSDQLLVWIVSLLSHIVIDQVMNALLRYLFISLLSIILCFSYSLYFFVFPPFYSLFFPSLFLFVSCNPVSTARVFWLLLDLWQKLRA